MGKCYGCNTEWSGFGVYCNQCRLIEETRKNTEEVRKSDRRKTNTPSGSPDSGSGATTLGDIYSDMKRNDPVAYRRFWIFIFIVFLVINYFTDWGLLEGIIWFIKEMAVACWNDIPGIFIFIWNVISWILIFIWDFVSWLFMSVFSLFF